MKSIISKIKSFPWMPWTWLGFCWLVGLTTGIIVGAPLWLLLIFILLLVVDKLFTLFNLIVMMASAKTASLALRNFLMTQQLQEEAMRLSQRTKMGPPEE